MKIPGIIICILYFFTIISCNEPKKTIVLFDREKELLEVLNHYKIPVEKTTVVLMPPTKCSSCKKEALKSLDTLTNAYILAGDSSIFYAKLPSQKCIYYDENYISKKGLVRLYSAIINIENAKVVKYKALMNN